MPAEGVAFEEVIGFATKTGFRGVIAWQADVPVAGYVQYGTSSTNLSQTAFPLADVVDRAQMAVIDGLAANSQVYYRVIDRISDVSSATRSFVANNAYKKWNGSTYTINALVQLDSEALPDDIPWDQGVKDLEKGVDILAERVYDALDGYARIGKVLITDTVLGYPANIPFGPQSSFGGTLGDAIRRLGCIPGVDNVNGLGAVGPTLADFLVQTSIPFDSHTFSGWMIDDPCTAFYIGRVGQLVVPWEDDLHLGYTMAHEFMHYAFNAPDLYLLNSTADCKNLTWDGSLMHNEGGWNGSMWVLTELDERQEITPCNHGSEDWSWIVLKERYTNVPARSSVNSGPGSATVDRGNSDGDALEIWILNQEPAGSSLCQVGRNCP